MDSLEVTDAQSRAVATEPRVSLDDINAAIAHEHYNLVDGVLTICILKLVNGFYVVGTSAPASPANFNEELGQKFARENAVRQLWPLMGFALRERLAEKGA